MITRRGFVMGGAALAAAPWLQGCASRKPAAPRVPADRKVRLAVVGVANRGKDNLDALAGQEIVALCDVDLRHLDAAAKRFPGARRYFDFRRLLAEVDEVDAVVVSTPDHTHFPAAALALRRGLHVYCEKPLTHSVAEARALQELAAQTGAVTQMGTQIHSLPNYRRVVELVQAGAIGRVERVHVFLGGTDWSGGDLPAVAPARPGHLLYDLWLGPAPEQPYHEAFHPMGWRRYWDFGGGTLADMACHFLDLPFWALGLGHCDWVETDGPAPHPRGAPNRMVVRWGFPARGSRPAVTLAWHQGGARPDELKGLGLDAWRSGVLFLGERGHLIADYHRHELGPAEVYRGYRRPPESIPASPGHHAEWLRAIQGGEAPTCEFAYAGPLTETVLLGNVAFRSGGGRLRWDAEALRIVDRPHANALLSRAPRGGWAV